MPSMLLTVAAHKCVHNQAKLTWYHKALHDKSTKKAVLQQIQVSAVMFVGYMLQMCLVACICALQLTVCMIKEATEQRRSTGLG